MTDVNQEVLVNDARCEVTGTGRPTIGVISCAVFAAAGSSDLVPKT
jgi:hypothetical protein